MQGAFRENDTLRLSIPSGRELWFDRDIDGRWIVGVTEIGSDHDEWLGSIVGRVEALGQFIDQLGKLLADAGQFVHELDLPGSK